MVHLTAAAVPPATTDDTLASRAQLEHAIGHAAHLLPAQGPINVFIHHNTLHAFEHLPFDEGVQQGSRLLGCQPYLSEDRYRQKLATERIRVDDLLAVLREDLGDTADEPVAGLGARLDLRLAMLTHPLRNAPAFELRWYVAETDALKRFRTDIAAPVKQRMLQETRHWVLREHLPTTNGASSASPPDPRIDQPVRGLLEQFGVASIEHWSESTWEAFTLQVLWRACREGVHGIKPSAPPPPAPQRHRDLLLEATGIDSDQLVHDLLIRFCAAFLDQGFAQWPLPERDRGLFCAFHTLFSKSGGPPSPWLRGLRQELARHQASNIEPLESIRQSLEILGVPPTEWESYITSSLLALRGWAGMIHQMEVRGDRAAHPVPPGSLVEFLAVRLILDRLALKHVAAEGLDFRGDLSDLAKAARARIKKPEPPTVEQRAFQIFQLAQALGWLPSDLFRLTKADWEVVVREVESLSGIERRRIFHAAFERRYRIQALDALAAHADHRFARPEAPRFQIVCCLDEREESFRRHLEEYAPDTETFGVAGFFNVAMYYRGAAEATFVPLCPIVVQPEHWVTENVAFTMDEEHRRRAATRRALGLAWHQLQVSSRSLAGGAVVAAGIGALATVPLVARVLFPRLTARVRRTASRLVQAPRLTQLQVERSTDSCGCDQGAVGYTVDEMADMAERMLRDIGLTTQFARLVILSGHGSSSVNNPHKSAYDCGACGGNCGGPNARAMALMLNDIRVRQKLAERDLIIPDTTIFIGAWHNTCNDAMTYYDLDRLPASHAADFSQAQEDLEQVCERNAHERCRRFNSAPLTLSPAAARRHVEARAEDLAQTRPELGHATNALCIVGRRSRTRGLFLDRRAFLTSYDPTLDTEDHAILTRLLAAAVPVCAGINLEYYFSHVDPTGYGCGTKLPHNVASLLGIMDGAASDLRTGLPWQMVEIHEPVRLLMVVETTPEAMLRIMDNHIGIGRPCYNGWVQVATLSPTSPEIHLLRNGKFERYEPESTELARVASSIDWYRGWREHLGFAAIEPAPGQGAG